MEDGGVVVGFGDVGELEEGSHGREGGGVGRGVGAGCDARTKGIGKGALSSLRFFGFLGWGVNV